MRARNTIVLFLVACRSSGGPDPKDEGGVDSVPFDDGDSGLVDSEACNGLDDDDDGEVDEGFADSDANGRADCVDLECPDEATEPGGSIAVLESCEAPLPADPWDIVAEWQYSSGGSGAGVFCNPATGYLFDDDGDGVLGSAGDIPQVVFANWLDEDDADALTILSGDGSPTAWSPLEVAQYRGVALADIDGDGWTEVVGYEQQGKVAAWRSDGSLLWESEQFDFLWYEQIVVADLDADGRPEVIADEAVINGEDGSTVRMLPTTTIYRSPIAGDIDLDGDQEIVFGADVYDSTGGLLWSTIEGGYTMFAAFIQADQDAEAEIAFVSDAGYHLYDTDGTELVTAELPSSEARDYAGPPCVADFDGDGSPEIGISTMRYFSMVELDGTINWSVATQDTGPTGCSSFDFDQDGAAEALIEDLYGIYLLDGRTGGERWSFEPGLQMNNSSGSEYPYVVDVDADGSAEIVAPTNNDPSQGILVFGHADGQWPGASPGWGVHDYSGSTQDDDGGIPVTPPTPWLDRVFRGQHPRPRDGADLLVSFGPVCVADCTYGPVELAVYVSNQGLEEAPAGVSLQLLAIDEADERLVATTTLPAIPAGTRLDAVEFSLSAAEVGEIGFAAVVNPTGAVPDCDSSNDRAEWREGGCM